MDRLLSFAILRGKPCALAAMSYGSRNGDRLERRAKYDVNARRELDGKKSLEYWFGLMVLGLLALWYGLVVMPAQPL